MKLTAVTGPNGELAALVFAHLSEHDHHKSFKNGPHAMLRPGPGQIFHEIVAPDGHENLTRAELRRWVMAQIRGHAE